MASDHDGRQYETRHGLDADVRADVIRRLNQSLADTTDLFTQTKHAHWNVKGEQFQQLHLLFDEQAELLAAQADRIAERLTALGGEAMGTTRMAAEHSQLSEYPGDAVESMDCVEALADRFAAHSTNLRENIDATLDAGDAVTSDMYTELAHDVDKQLWFLEAHLQGPRAVVDTGVTLPAED